MESRYIKKFDIMTAILICATLLIIIIILVLRMVNTNPTKTFRKEVNTVYDSLTMQYERDKETFKEEDEATYFSTVILKNEDVLNYVAEFDKETDKLIYFCISNGNLQMKLNGDITNEYITNNGIIEQTNEKCEL